MERLATLIASCATLIAAITTVVIGILNRKKIQEVHISIDGRMDQLLASHGAEMKAVGGAEERERDHSGD
jgi:hypothetical protein